MQRRDFIKNGATLGLGLGLGFSSLKKWYDEENGPLRLRDLAAVSEKLEADFEEMLHWLRNNGWAAHLSTTLNINLDLTGDLLKKELIRTIDPGMLTALRNKEGSGYDDFSGERLVQPGFPAYSLLFHTMASPRVRPADITDFPSLAQIDLMENYVYALADWEQLKSIYGVKSNSNLVLAVFAYEYRPAFKTPHHAYADMVYSRTGIARIGTEEMNYDAVNRCYTAQPLDAAKVRNPAVMPARYGLFLARKVRHTDISLIKSDKVKQDECGKEKENNCRDDRHDAHKTFLQPIRKIFNDDELVGAVNIPFSEQHKSEKIKKLLTINIKFWDNLVPAERWSKDLILQDDAKRKQGSSFLVISKPEALIRHAEVNGRKLYFQVPKQVKAPFDNRYFTALATQEVEDVELLNDTKPLTRSYNDYSQPRNQPMFVNITHEKDAAGNSYTTLDKAKNGEFEKKMSNGKYYAPLFEDSICDGMVKADTAVLKLDKLQGLNAHCLPAFSIVTAPDFFPQVDPLDLKQFDIAPGPGTDTHFYEGGVASLASARIRPNPKMVDSKADDTRDTYLAVVSNTKKANTGVPADKLSIYENPLSERGYEISGFLPDIASSVFAPGWDVTYCSLDNVKDIYIGTEGLGSPFVEDMKFCAALNGMWPATSPDAARTFQGANDPGYRNPTAVPLLDNEIGISGLGPAGMAKNSTGWDGEQGPYLEKKGNKWMVNFCDMGRSDAVNNTMEGKIDMQQLRKLKSNELINRMACLKLCINSLKQKNFRAEEFKSKQVAFTYLWLVSAEKVNWGKADAEALGIPANLVGNDKSWIASKDNAKIFGDGYLYVFANSVPDMNPNKDWADDLKRRRLECREIYVCQVTNEDVSPKIAWTEIKNGKVDWKVK